MVVAINLAEDLHRIAHATLQIILFIEGDRGIGRKGKACMIYVPVRMWTLRVSISFMVIDGPPF